MKSNKLVASTIIATSLFVVSMSVMAATPIEPRAVIDRELSPQIIEGMTALARGRGYSCDSVTVARKMLVGNGFVLVCNNARYEYEIEDKGGNWIFTVK